MGRELTKNYFFPSTAKITSFNCKFLITRIFGWKNTLESLKSLWWSVTFMRRGNKTMDGLLPLWIKHVYCTSHPTPTILVIELRIIYRENLPTKSFPPLKISPDHAKQQPNNSCPWINLLLKQPCKTNLKPLNVSNEIFLGRPWIVALNI